jgi:hypothetical protein
MTQSTTRLALLSAAPLLLALAGCSPHPATGSWISPTQADSGFSRLEVTYEGQALLFEAGEKEAGRRCFWGGESAQAIALTCKPAFNPESEERYRLTIGEDGSASLTRDGKVAARFSRPDR